MYPKEISTFTSGYTYKVGTGDGEYPANKDSFAQAADAGDLLGLEIGDCVLIVGSKFWHLVLWINGTIVGKTTDTPAPRYATVSACRLQQPISVVPFADSP